MEHTIDLERISLTVYRLDFKAVVKTDTGEKIILIEVQKAKFLSDIMRFQRSNKENRDIPILSIYFLGYNLTHVKAPVIKVQSEYINLATNSRITEREDFIESLTHNSFIIQVQSLHSPYNSEIEKFLSIFDQTEKCENDHILEIKENEYPDYYRKLLRKLQKAALESKLRKDMEIEDEIVEELDNLERVIEKQELALSEKDSQLSKQSRIIDELKRKLGKNK